MPLSRGRAGGDFGGEWVGGGDRRARVAQGAGGFDAAGDGQQGARLTEALFSSQQGTWGSPYHRLSAPASPHVHSKMRPRRLGASLTSTAFPQTAIDTPPRMDLTG